MYDSQLGRCAAILRPEGGGEREKERESFSSRTLGGTKNMSIHNQFNQLTFLL